MAAVLREPFLHFLVLGALIFAVFAALDDPPDEEPHDRLKVTAADAMRLARQFEAILQRPPSETELSGLIDSFIREEVLVREARALSLDRDDPVIRQHLVQKMQFLLESDADAAVPTDDELSAYFQHNAEKFAIAPLVSFEQLQLDPDTENAETVLAALQAGSDPGAFGRPSALPRDIPPVAKPVVDGTFGKGFFDRLTGLQIGRWSGPVESAYGSHLVRVSLVEPGRQPSFDEIRQQVEQDWRRTKAEEAYDALLSRYEILLPDTSDIPAR